MIKKVNFKKELEWLIELEWQIEGDKKKSIEDLLISLSEDILREANFYCLDVWQLEDLLIAYLLNNRSYDER